MPVGSAVRLGMLALLWGSSFLWTNLALRGFTPAQIVFARLALGAGILVVLARSRGLRFPAGWRLWSCVAVAAVVANVVPYLLFAIAVQHVDTAVAGVLNATTPLWTFGFALVAGIGQPDGIHRAAGLLVGFAGAMLIFSPWNAGGEVASWAGIACLTAAMSYGLSYVYMARYLVGRGITPIALSGAQLGVAAVISTALLPFAGTHSPSWRADALIGMLILGIAGSGIAYVLNYRLIADEGPTVASAVTYLLPVVAIILGALVLGENVTVVMIIGTALVLVGVAAIQRRRGADTRSSKGSSPTSLSARSASTID